MDHETTLTYAGAGGIIACCFVLELLGGAAALTTVATWIGLSTSTAYLVTVSLTGIIITAVTYIILQDKRNSQQTDDNQSR